MSDEIGVPLFDYIGRQLYLTQAGHELLQTCRDIIGNVEQFNHKLNTLKKSECGELTLCGVSGTECFIPTILCRFRRHYPDIFLKFKIVDYDVLCERLAAGKDDYYITDKLFDNVELNIDFTLLNQVDIIAASTSKLARQSNIPLQEIEQASFILGEQGSGTRMVIENFFNKKNININVIMECDNNEAIKHAVADNIGLSAQSDFALSGNIYNSRIVKLHIIDFPLEESWYVVHARGHRISHIARAFLKIRKSISYKLTRTNIYLIS